MGLDAPSRQLDMGQGAAKAGKPLPRGELVGEARGGLARRRDIYCCDPTTPKHSPTLNPPGLNGRHEPDEGTRMCGGADPKREDGHGAHVLNGGDRVRDRDCAEIRAAIICLSANLRRVCRDYDMAIRIRCDRAAACACCYCQSHCGRPEHIQRTVPLPEDCSMRHCSGKRQRTPKGVHG